MCALFRSSEKVISKIKCNWISNIRWWSKTRDFLDCLAINKTLWVRFKHKMNLLHSQGAIFNSMGTSKSLNKNYLCLFVRSFHETFGDIVRITYTTLLLLLRLITIRRNNHNFKKNTNSKTYSLQNIPTRFVAILWKCHWSESATRGRFFPHCAATCVPWVTKLGPRIVCQGILWGIVGVELLQVVGGWIPDIFPMSPDVVGSC